MEKSSREFIALLLNTRTEIISELCVYAQFAAIWEDVPPADKELFGQILDRITMKFAEGYADLLIKTAANMQKGGE